MQHLNRFSFNPQSVPNSQIPQSIMEQNQDGQFIVSMVPTMKTSQKLEPSNTHMQFNGPNENLSHNRMNSSNARIGGHTLLSNDTLHTNPLVQSDRFEPSSKKSLKMQTMQK